MHILDITAPDINNGNGIRVTLWVAGCKHKCKGCHNHWTWNFNEGKSFKDNFIKAMKTMEQRYYQKNIETEKGKDLFCKSTCIYRV